MRTRTEVTIAYFICTLLQMHMVCAPTSAAEQSTTAAASIKGATSQAAASDGPAVSRQIAASCHTVEYRATQYLAKHDFYSVSKGQDLIEIGNQKKASMPSGELLRLNRFSIRRYTLPRHLSPFKTYADFRLEGRLHLTILTEDSCKLSLDFGISAYEWVSALAAIDDGYRKQFVSNGVLEHLYLDAIADLFETTDAAPSRKNTQ